MRPTLIRAAARALVTTARRVSGAVTLAALLFCLSAAGCATAKGGASSEPPSSPPVASESRSGSASARPADAPAGPSVGSTIGGYVLAVPENIVWIPWKMIGGAFKGAGDGVGAGFAKGRLPALGVLFSPINLVTGFVTGFAEGAFMSPGVIGPSDNFGRTMALPTKRVTSVWWYP